MARSAGGQAQTAVEPAAPQQIAPGSARIAARLPLPQSSRARLHPYDIAYLDDDTLLATYPDVGPEGARNTSQIWAMDSHGRNLRVWASEITRDWYPVTIDAHPGQSVAIVGDRRRSQLQLFDATGQRLQRWRLQGVRAGVPEPAAMAPDGSMWILAGVGPGTYDGQRIEHLANDGSPLQGFPFQRLADGSEPQPYAHAITVDSEGNLYAAVSALGECDQPERFCPDVDPPLRHIYAFSPEGDWLGEVGAPDDGLPWAGWHDELALAGWPAQDRLIIGHSDPPAVEVRELSSDRRLRYSLSPGAPPLDLARAVATAPGGGIAAMFGFATLPKRSSAPNGDIVQFTPEGEPHSRLVVRGTAPAFWHGGRLDVDGQGRIHVIDQNSQQLLTLSEAGELLATAPAPSWPVDVAAHADGHVAMKGSSGRIGHVELVGPDLASLWMAECACDATAAVAIFGDTVVTGDAVAGRISVFGRPNGASRPRVAERGPGSFFPTDTSAGPEGLDVLDGPAQVVIRWPSGASSPTGSMHVGANALRLDTGNDGALAILYSGEAIGVFGPGGDRTHLIDLRSLKVPDGRHLASEVRDLAWMSPDKLAVFDAVEDNTGRPSILILELGAEAVRDVPDEGTEGACDVDGTKTAEPSTILLGDAVTVTLTLELDCPARPENLVDVAVVLPDLSYRSATERLDWEIAQHVAFKRLIDGLDLGRVRVALLQEGNGLHTALSADRAVLLGALDRVGQRWPYQEPADWSQHFGFDAAAEHLSRAGRPDARKLIVLGLRREPADYFFYDASAQRAKSAGVEIAIVDYESPPDPRIASWPTVPTWLLGWADNYTTDRLFESIGRVVAPSAVAGLRVVDWLHADVSLVPGSEAPPPSSSQRRLEWSFASAPRPLTMSYRVIPNRTGVVPMNEMAVATFMDPGGGERSFRYPIPEVLVLAPEAVPSPTRPKPRTPAPAEPLFLPVVVREKCEPSLRQLDVVLVIDASTSMLEPTASGRTKLSAAVAAAGTFLDALVLGLGDQAAIVSFNSEARLLSKLTGDRGRLNEALAGIEVSQSTRIDEGIDAAAAELESTRARSGARTVMIVLTDGRANPVGPEAAVEKARSAKARGVLIFTIGVGEDLDVAALAEIATLPDYFYRTADAEGLAEIYSTIADTIPCPAESFWPH